MAIEIAERRVEIVRQRARLHLKFFAPECLTMCIDQHDKSRPVRFEIRL